MGSTVRSPVCPLAVHGTPLAKHPAQLPRPRSAVFLDRDDVIDANWADYVLGWDQRKYLPAALKTLALLADAGLPVIVVTNQTIVGKGLITVYVLDDMHAQAMIRRS